MWLSSGYWFRLRRRVSPSLGQSVASRAFRHAIPLWIFRSPVPRFWNVCSIASCGPSRRVLINLDRTWRRGHRVEASRIGLQLGPLPSVGAGQESRRGGLRRLSHECIIPREIADVLQALPTQNRQAPPIHRRNADRSPIMPRCPNRLSPDSDSVPVPVALGSAIRLWGLM